MNRIFSWDERSFSFVKTFLRFLIFKLLLFNKVNLYYYKNESSPRNIVILFEFSIVELKAFWVGKSEGYVHDFWRRNLVKAKPLALKKRIMTFSYFPFLCWIPSYILEWNSIVKATILELIIELDCQTAETVLFVYSMFQSNSIICSTTKVLYFKTCPFFVGWIFKCFYERGNVK